jgi:aminoglycoside phosphotransferase (APT) family kinase protein
MKTLSRAHREALARLLPGGGPAETVTRVRRIGGGLDSEVYAVTLRGPAGSRRVVFRRQDPAGHLRESEHTRAEVLTYGHARDAGIPVPTILFADPEGEHFGSPTLVLSFAGSADVSPRTLSRRVPQLAAALARIHTVIEEAGISLSYLKPRTEPRDAISAIAAVIRERPADPFAHRVIAAIKHTSGRVEPLPPTLLHGDYHPGNVVWKRGTLAAVIDWSQAGTGDPRIDVSQCRADLALTSGLAAADAFLAAYEQARGVTLPDMWRFDLIAGARALAYHESWLGGYLEQALDLPLAEAHSNVVAYLESALERPNTGSEPRP